MSLSTQSLHPGPAQSTRGPALRSASVALVATILALCGSLAPPGPTGGVVCETYYEGLKDLLSSLLNWTAVHPTHAYDAAIQQLGVAACRGTPFDCLYDRSENVEPQQIAIWLLDIPDEPMRAAGVAVACGLCAEVDLPCTCDGRSCDAQDIAPPFHSKLGCGFTVLEDGRLVAWGKAMRALSLSR
jgi:hypothetical protein